MGKIVTEWPESYMGTDDYLRRSVEAGRHGFDLTAFMQALLRESERTHSSKLMARWSAHREDELYKASRRATHGD